MLGQTQALVARGGPELVLRVLVLRGVVTEECGLDLLFQALGTVLFQVVA